MEIFVWNKVALKKKKRNSYVEKTYNHGKEGPTYVSLFVFIFLRSSSILFLIFAFYTEKEERERKTKMTRGKQKIEAQKRNAEKNQKSKGSQLEARAVGLKVICPICKVSNFAFFSSKKIPFSSSHSFFLLLFSTSHKKNWILIVGCLWITLWSPAVVFVVAVVISFMFSHRISRSGCCLFPFIFLLFFVF